mmetsp:Transcript_11348/g.25269  ORF Transcript_11348/g.25269 Transcript_11348/m.25269 type:complete len:442 (+) Transcript_11348:65-1390(+)
MKISFALLAFSLRLHTAQGKDGTIRGKATLDNVKDGEDKVFWERFLNFNPDFIEDGAYDYPFDATSMPTSSPPTPTPTTTPTASPTASPTNTPTASPTSQPTASPTSSPTASPTSSPTASPTNTPTTTPTTTPTSAPTVPCFLNITSEGPNITIPPCIDRPTLFGMEFVGGDCSNTQTEQPANLTNCTDFFENGNVPEPGSGETSFIMVVTGGALESFVEGDGNETYFAGNVKEDDVYYIYRDGDRLPSDLTIFTFPEVPTADIPPLGSFPNSTLYPPLQEANFHSSCSQEVLLFNQFGAHTVVQFENLRQGNVTVLDTVNETVTFTISVPELPPGEDTVIVASAELSRNYTVPQLDTQPIYINGTLICTEGAAVDPTNPCTISELEVDVEVEFDLKNPQTYALTLEVIANTEISNQFCEGENTFEYCAPENTEVCNAVGF